MTQLRYPADLPVTVEDACACGWKDMLARMLDRLLSTSIPEQLCGVKLARHTRWNTRTANVDDGEKTDRESHGGINA